MGSCSEDCKVEGESVTLGDEDGDRSLEVESKDNEAKQVDLASGKEFVEEVVSLNGLYCGVNIGDGCMELVIGVKEAETKSIGVMGAEEENGHLELEKAADLSVLKSDFEGFDRCSDLNLRGELEANEYKQVNLEREDGERERESGHLELGKGFVDEVGSLINKDSGCETGKGCGELVVKESGHLGLGHDLDVSVSKKDFEGFEVEACPTPDMGDIINDINGGAHCNDSENEQRKLVSKVHEDEEQGQEILMVVEENMHLGLEQTVKVDILWKDFNHCEMQPSSANGDAPDPSNVASVDSGINLKDLAFEKKADDVNCSGHAGCEKENELIGLALKLEVNAVERVLEKSGSFGRSSSENIDESKDCNNGASVHTLEVMNNAVSLGTSSGYGESASGKKEVENECLEDFGSDEEIKHIGLQRDSKSVSDQEHDEFPGLSPLRTLGGGEFACSVFGMGSEVGLLSSGVLDSDGIRNECEGAEILVSSGLAADCPLLRIDKDASTAADGHCCPRDDSRDFEASCMVERCGKLCSFGNEKVDFGHYNEVDNIGRSDSKSNPILVFRRSNPKRSASLRSNLADGKYNQSSTGNNRRNGKKAVHIIPTFLLRTIKISDKLKRKRSSHRLARQSLWGPVENLINIFEQTSRFVGHDADKIHVRNKRSKKRMPIGSSKKQAKTQKDGNTCASSGNHSATYDKVEVKHKWAGDNFPFTVESLPLGRQLVDKDVESSLTQEASVELGELPGVSSQIDPEMFVETVSDRSFLDPGTSPDSDVYHPVMDDATRTNEVAIIMTNDSDRTTSTIQFRETCQNMHVLGTVSKDGLHSSAATSTETLATSLLVPPPHPNLCAKPKKGERSGKHGEQTIVEKLHGPDNQNNTKLSNCGKAKHKTEAAINKKNSICSKSIKKTSRKGSKDKSFPRRSYVLETTNLEHIDESVKGQDSLEKYVLPAEDFINTWKGHDLSSGTKPCKGITHCRETTRQKRDNAHAKMGKGVQKSDNRCSTEERTQTVDASVDASDYMSLSSGALNPALTMSTEQNCKSNASNRAVLDDVSSLVMTSAGDQLIPNDSKTGMEQSLPPQVAWVLCDDCEKWRCISAELANTLEETKCKWTCKDNTDKAFSDCSIPQEKTNAEINAELGILDEDPSSVEANANGDEPLKLASKRTSWIPIKSNVFLHRNRKTQTIDEIMVCHCKRPRDGRRGCGDQCLNRMLNIECAKGTCPCGDLCSNQRFQKRKYAKFEWLRCGKKGYGLQLQEDAPQGQFLIEYVGEVLDLATYDARQRCYASQGQKHFYFMTLNGGEVIDACAKGNLGRFINHSCEPNCRTEKWMVNGEVCIGLFAIRDIKKGEEVTFDYNYVRVVGAAAKKCICGSSECRGYLGGDPLNSEIIVQSDSDEEDSEQVMMNKKGQREFDSISNANDVKISKNKENLLEREEKVIMQPPATPEYEVCAQNEGAVCRARSEVNPLDNCLRNLDPRQAEDIISRPDTQPDGDSEQSLNSAPIEESVFKRILDIQPQDISVEASTSMAAVLLDSVLNKQKAVTDFSADKPNISKPHSLIKSSYSRGTIKRRRSNVKNMVSAKPKTFAAVVGSGHLNSVESKLNELLEMDGGISKQKDATSGYLRLLFVTAAEGDVGGCASQSTRDLSLILDAILKTKSRKVLVDIINTNGLQMLHNIMKQNRGDFNRIPILRKLLKVLEFLALTEILTPELINKDPPYNGMESFKESILKLANHGDKQVHKIARGFRDKWIPRNIKRIEPSDRDSVQLDRQIPHHNCCIQSSIVKCQQVDAARGTDAIVIVGTADHQRSASSSELDNPRGTSALSVTDDNRSASGTKTCKRKSRWDHPSDFTTTDPPDHSFEEPGPKFPKCTPDLHNVADANSSQDLMQLDCDDGRPPGFFEDDDGLPPGFQNNHQAQNSPSTQTAVVTGEEFVMGHPQKIYLSRMTMSYGIPVAVLQQLGAPATGENLHQRGNQNWAIAPGMPFHPFPPLPSYPRKPVRQQIDTGVGLPGPSEGGMSETITGSRNSEFGGRRLRFPSNRGHGSRFPHPQRWDNSNNKRRRFQSCWPHGPNQCLGRGGFRGGSNIRNGVRNVRGNFGRSYVLQML